MTDPGPRSQTAFVLRVVWIALVVSQCIYLAIPAPERRGESTNLSMFFGALALVAVAEGIGATVWFRIAAVGRIRSGRLDPSTAQGAARLFQVVILCWVLVESIAIYGLVLRFLHAPLWMTGSFAAFAFVLMAALNPFQSGLQPPVDSAARGNDPTPIV